MIGAIFDSKLHRMFSVVLFWTTICSSTEPRPSKGPGKRRSRERVEVKSTKGKMDANRKLWNQGQQALRVALSRPTDHQRAIELFLVQHAMVHSARMSQSRLWSLEDAVWEGLTEEAIRCIPLNHEHSIIWNIWHIARIEDITMNLLIAGTPQVLSEADWPNRMRVKARDTGNTMNSQEVKNFSLRVDIEALRAYRNAVGRRTREIIKCLEPGETKQKIEPSRPAPER